MRYNLKYQHRHAWSIKAIMMSVVSLTFIMIGSLAIGSQYTAFAENVGTSLTLSPMNQKIILVPGETYEGSIKVVNGTNADKVLSYEASVGSYSPTKTEKSKDDYSGSDTVTRSNQNIMMDWTTIENKTGSLKPNDVSILKFKIEVPKDAPAGAQYISLLVSEVQGDSTSSSGNSVNIDSKVQLASIVYANVAGETIENGSIKENSMPTILTTNTLEATSMVRNDGNIYTDASYTLQVWPMFSDEEICTNEESAESSLVLPNTERYHVQTCNLPMVGIFKAKQVVSIFGEQSVLEKTIFVCPIWLMILVLVIVIAIIIAIIVIIKKHSKKAED